MEDDFKKINDMKIMEHALIIKTFSTHLIFAFIHSIDKRSFADLFSLIDDAFQ